MVIRGSSLSGHHKGHHSIRSTTRDARKISCLPFVMRGGIRLTGPLVKVTWRRGIPARVSVQSSRLALSEGTWETEEGLGNLRGNRRVGKPRTNHPAPGLAPPSPAEHGITPKKSPLPTVYDVTGDSVEKREGHKHHEPFGAKHAWSRDAPWRDLIQKGEGQKLDFRAAVEGTDE